jgi:hypothetical protein
MQVYIHCTRKVTPWYSLLLEWTPGLLSADGRTMSLEHFQGPHRQTNRRHPVLWRSASTNCVTARPFKIIFWNKLSRINRGLVQNRPDRLWSPPILLFSGYWGSAPGVKRPGRESDPHFYLVPMLGTSGVILLLPICLRGVYGDRFTLFI